VGPWAVNEEAALPRIGHQPPRPLSRARGRNLLTVNSGSSSLKFSVFAWGGQAGAGRSRAGLNGSDFRAPGSSWPATQASGRERKHVDSPNLEAAGRPADSTGSGRLSAPDRWPRWDTVSCTAVQHFLPEPVTDALLDDLRKDRPVRPPDPTSTRRDRADRGVPSP